MTVDKMRPLRYMGLCTSRAVTRCTRLTCIKIPIFSTTKNNVIWSYPQNARQHAPPKGTHRMLQSKTDRMVNKTL